MKKAFTLAMLLLSLSAFSQEKKGLASGILDRFTDSEKGRTVFVEKGHRSLGISGGYRSYKGNGEAENDGYGILSLLNVGDGYIRMYNVSPNFSYFVADDLSLGLRLDYSGYQVDSDLKLDLRDIALTLLPESGLDEIANIQILSRHMVSNAWGGSFVTRKYLSFFGSKMLGVFGEARLYGRYGHIVSAPIVDYKTDEKGRPIKDAEGSRIYVDPYPLEAKQRVSDAFSVGLSLAAGACLRLRDNSAFTVSIPLVGAVYSHSKQLDHLTGNVASLSQFRIARELDFLGIQIGYTRFIKSKKH